MPRSICGFNDWRIRLLQDYRWHKVILIQPDVDPMTGMMVIVVDAHKAIGKDLKGFGNQAKIHTRNNVGVSGLIYFGTKHGYPDTGKGEKREDYPGGYPMVYDPKTSIVRRNLFEEPASRIRYEMGKLHDRVMKLKDVTPPESPKGRAWWQIWGS